MNGLLLLGWLMPDKFCLGRQLSIFIDTFKMFLVRIPTIWSSSRQKATYEPLPRRPDWAYTGQESERTEVIHGEAAWGY
jgi:hypothetical protein